MRIDWSGAFSQGGRTIFKKGIQMDSRKNGFGRLLAVLSIYFLTTGINAVQPALDSIAGEFPNVPLTLIYLLNTVPTLVGLLVILLMGRTVGRHVPFRVAALFGVAAFSVIGVAPFFLEGFPIILASRALLGIGVGIITMLGPALALLLFDEGERSKVLGATNFANNLGNMFFLLVGGMLASFGWRMTFLSYLVGAATLVVIAFLLPEPQTAGGEDAGSEQERIPGAVFRISLFFGMNILFLIPAYLNFSSLVVSAGVGDAAIAGGLLSAGTVAGMVAGLLYGRFRSVFGGASMAASSMCGLISAVLLWKGNGLGALLLGSLFAGACMSLLIITATMDVGMVCSPSVTARATGIAMGAMSIGSFMASFYAGALSAVPGQDPLRFVFLVSAIGFGLLAAMELLAWRRAR